jgi:hypothetical protein
MMAAYGVMAAIVLMLVSGTWSPRVVEKDQGGSVVGDVVGPPRQLPPGTPVTH